MTITHFYNSPRIIRNLTWIWLAVLCLPLLIWNFVPFQDYPSRIYEAHIYHELGNPDSVFHNYYQRQTLWMTNRFFTVFYIALAQLMPIIWAGKIAVVVLIVVYQWSVYYFIKRIRPELIWASLFNILFTYHLYLVRGSVNYCYSAAFSLLALGLALPAIRDLTWRSWPVKNWLSLVALILLMFFTHPVPLWIFTSILILMGLLYHHKIKWIVGILVLIILGIPLLAVPFSNLIFKIFGKIGGGDPLVYPSFIGKITAILGFPFTYHPLVYALVILPLLVYLLYSCKSAIPQMIQNPYTRMVFFLWLLIIALPAGSLIMINSLDSRVGTYLIPFGLLALPSLSDRTKLRINTILQATCLIYTVFIFFIFFNFNHSLQGFREFLSTMKPGKTMVSYNDWNFSRPVSVKEIVDYLIKKDIVLPYTLIPAYYGIEKNAPGGPVFLIFHQCVIREYQTVKDPYYVFYVYNHTREYQPADWVLANYQLVFKTPFMDIFEKKPITSQ